jgi:hypothetical protein
MPNPIAHPAASVPFARVGMVLSALVVGSIAPDFGYVIPLPTSFYMYTLPGLFLFDVPVGLILLWLFHAFAKWPLLSLLPVRLQRRLFKYAQGFSFGPFKHFLLIVLSLLIGSVTHVIWDSFTHPYGWVVEHFPLFRNPIGGIPLYTILQNGGTVLGVGLLAYWFFRWLPTAAESDQSLPRFSRRVQTIFLGLAVVSLAVVEGRIIYGRLLTGSRFIGGRFLLMSILFSIVLVASFFIAIYCVIWIVRFYKSIHPAQPDGR